MAQLLTCKNISKTYGSEALFEELTISLEENCRCGIIGPNGTGKSTFLKLLAGIEKIDGGEISKKRGLRISYVDQIRQFSDEDSVHSVLKKAALDSGFDEINAETNVAILSSQLAFDSVSSKALSLSGGWQKRLVIAEQLIKEPDLLLLDEPTNHLDLEGLLWLEKILSSANFSWVLITHDRYFLDKLAKEIIEINPCYPEGYLRSQGGYKDHISHKEDVFTAIESQEQTLSSKVRRETEWLQRGPKARTTKARFRIDQAHQLQKDLAALRKLKRTEKANIDFSSSNRKTKSLISLNSAEIGYKDPLYKDLELSISKGDRLGILGANGSGKSTLIKSLIGSLDLISGERKQAEDLSIVHFSQSRDEIDPEFTLKRAMGEGQEQVIFRDRPVHIVSWAKRFGFSMEDLSTKVKDLSGGQLARVHISLLMLNKADILFLDEPTNDLDLETIEIVESSLLSFPGAIVMVSHDRRFLENICLKFIGLKNKKHSIIASYSQWEKGVGKGSEPAKKKGSTSNSANQNNKSQKKDKKAKLSFKDKYELEHIEENIQTAESELESASKVVEELSSSPDHKALLEATEKMESAQGEVDRLYARWDELESLVAEIES